MEAIYDFLHEWADELFIMCFWAVILLALFSRRTDFLKEESDSENEEASENEVAEAEAEPVEEAQTESDVEILGVANQDDVVDVVPIVSVSEVRNLPPRHFGKYTATSQTDAVLAAYSELLPNGYEELEKLRKEFKTLGGKSATEMTQPERTRYAVLAHILTVFR